MRVLSVFGTRPEAIKMAPVVRQLASTPGVESRVCVTAQHREMLDQVLELFDIHPEHDLSIMRPDQTLAQITAGVLTGLETVLEAEEPDLMLVHGDTTTTFAAALAGFYRGVEVGHVEAGLRTGDLLAPWPEEANRRLAAVLTRWHFAPTETAARNLLAESVDASRVHVTGNAVIDALHLGLEILAASGPRDVLRDVDSQKRLILVTGHRRENFGEGFQSVCSAISRIAQRADVQVIYPVHLNPNVREPVRRALGDLDNVHLLEPLGYLDFLALLDRCHIVLTDSGGIQEEAPSLGKPVLVMRNETERPEAVNAGTVKLVGTDEEQIVAAVAQLLDDAVSYENMSKAHNPYGDGRAAERIVEALVGRRP